MGEGVLEDMDPEATADNIHTKEGCQSVEELLEPMCRNGNYL